MQEDVIQRLRVYQIREVQEQEDWRVEGDDREATAGLAIPKVFKLTSCITTPVWKKVTKGLDVPTTESDGTAIEEVYFEAYRGVWGNEKGVLTLKGKTSGNVEATYFLDYRDGSYSFTAQVAQKK
ncbi:unnamed protein product [Peronospora belbahrii]|uniref:Uncharacterized protein n=1 Tax=Peronospora belbahrii TaxID=622444 RepID=A0ABN8DC89_9STRA|nr:unnamed protein product [Peronospora belbahrii]